MKEAIKLAIEGGWEKQRSGRFLEPTDDGVAYCIEETDTAEGWISTEYMFIDPSWWQALGKAMGWKETPDYIQEHTFKGMGWWHKWHDFIDHLAEGKDADSFFNELLK